jgi:hypothetical protein
MSAQRPIHLIIEKLTIGIDARSDRVRALAYDESTGEVVLRMPLPEENNTATIEGEIQMAYSIRDVELRFSDDIARRIRNAFPSDSLN